MGARTARYQAAALPEELAFAVAGAVRRGERQRKGRRALRRAAATALAGCACFALLLNVSPTFAGAVYQVPVLGQLARVITVKEYSINDRDHLIDVRLPALELAANTDLEQRVNTEIRTRIDQVLQEAEDRARETREAYVATGGAQSDFIPIIITVDYEIKCQNGQYLSFVLTKTETLASAYTEVYTYNIDLPGRAGGLPAGFAGAQLQTAGQPGDPRGDRPAGGGGPGQPVLPRRGRGGGLYLHCRRPAVLSQRGRRTRGGL